MIHKRYYNSTTGKLTGLVLSVTLLTSACTNLTKTPHSELIQSEMGFTQTIDISHQYSIKKGENSQFIQDGENLYKVFTSEKNGLQVFDQNNTPIASISKATELLDYRKIDDHTFLISSKSAQGNSVEFFLLETPENQSAHLLHLASHPITNFEIEGFCLHEDRVNNIHLFLLNGKGMGQQYLVAPSLNQTQLNFVRSLAMPLRSEHCVTDDSNQNLLVSEENIGIWIYSTNPEIELSREPFLLTKPYGALIAEVGPMAISGEQLAVTDLATNKIHLFNIPTQKHITSLRLNKSKSIESLALSEDSNLFSLLAFDDSSQKYHLYQFKNERNHSQQPRNPQLKPAIVIIPPSDETLPIKRTGDVADDPAIWVHPSRPQHSIILGTNKKAGLHVYDLQGNQLQFLQSGRLNNVDLRQGIQFQLRNQRKITQDVAAASNRDRNSIDLFQINNNGQVTQTTSIQTDLSDIYGLCSLLTNNGQYHVLVNDKDGRFQQWRIEAIDNSTYQGIKVREFKLQSQPEGCVADDKNQRIFLGEEDQGVWVIDSSPASTKAPELIMAVGDVLVDDVEGLALYQTNGTNYLVVSSQGDDSYLILDAEPPYQLQGKFQIGANASKRIDGASETDGLAVTTHRLGQKYPTGMLVVQDGRNVMPEDGQNFKMVSWQKVSRQLGLK